MSWVTDCAPNCHMASSPTSLEDPFLGWVMCMSCGRMAPLPERLRNVPPKPVAVWVPRPESLLARRLARGSALVSLACTFADGQDLVVHVAEPTFWPECRTYQELTVSAANALLQGRLSLRPLVVGWGAVLPAGMVCDSELTMNQPGRVRHWAAL